MTDTSEPASKYRFCPRCGKALVTRAVEAPQNESKPPPLRRACDDPACGFVHYDNPLPVVAAIVEHPDGVLLVRNHGWPEKMFGLVTGFLERDESPEEGVLRELHEELGLTGEVVSLVGAYAFTQRNELLVSYHVRASGTVTLGPEIAAFKAVKIEKLRPWPFGTGMAVRDWLRGRGIAVE